MARRGRFGRSETGASDLSATIRSLVQQQLAAEEQMLFKAFYEGTSFGGSVPSYSDLVSFVNERIGQGSSSDSQMAYYETLLNQAKKFEVGNTFKDLESSFYGTQGQNYDEMVSFLKGEGSEYGSQLYKFTKDYVTTYLADDLAGDRIDEAEFMSRSQNALNAFVDNAALYDDVKYDVYSELYEYQLGEQKDILARINPSKDKQVIKANEGLLEFYRGWETKLNENGIAGDFLDTVKNNIATTNFKVKEQKRVAADNAATALLSSRKSAYENAQITLDGFAKEIAGSIGIDSSAEGFGFNDIPAVTLASVLDDFSPSVQSQIRMALNDLQKNASAYSQTLQSQGNRAEALQIRDVSTAAKLASGQDVSFERYVKQSELKDALMAAADGYPSDELAVTRDWVGFLRGQTTASFGGGLQPGTDRSGQEVRTNIENEASAFEAALQGKSLGIIPKLWLDDFQSAQLSQSGLSNSAKDFYGQEFSGDNKFTAAELSNIKISIDLEKKIASGQTVIQRTKNANGTYDTNYIDAGVPAPGGGRLYKMEQTAGGKVVTVAYDGVPIYGAIAGNPDLRQPWGYKFETSGGDLYSDAKSGVVYTQPPIDVNKIRQSGASAILITSDIVEPEPGANGNLIIPGVKTSGTGSVASLDDFIAPNAIRAIENQGVNPYARVSSDDQRIKDQEGILANLRNIRDSLPASSQDAADLTIRKVETSLNALTGRSEDSGVRVAQMNAELAKQAATEFAKTKEQTGSISGISPNPLSRVPSSADAAASGRVSSVLGEGAQEIFGGANVFFRELGKLAGGVGAGALQGAGALAYGIPSAVGGALSAGINFVLPGIPGSSGSGATSLAPREFAPTGQVNPLSVRPLPKGTPRTTSPGAGLSLTAQPFVEFRAGERASGTISTPRTTTRAVTPLGGRTGR
jgi:hypothetical protein